LPEKDFRHLYMGASVRVALPKMKKSENLFEIFFGGVFREGVRYAHYRQHKCCLALFIIATFSCATTC